MTEPAIILQEEQDKLFEDLRFAANERCKNCYGRGYTAIDQNTGAPIVCRCVWKTVKDDESLNLRDYIAKHKPMIIE